MVAAGGFTHVNITVQYTLENFVETPRSLQESLESLHETLESLQEILESLQEDLRRYRKPS